MVFSAWLAEGWIGWAMGRVCMMDSKFKMDVNNDWMSFNFKIVRIKVHHHEVNKNTASSPMTDRIQMM